MESSHARLRRILIASIRPSLFLPASGVLLAASLLKLDSIASPFSGRIGLHHVALDGLFAVCELVIAIWLLSGVRPKIARRSGIVLFSVFLVVSGYHVVNGDATCGCFGEVAVPPVFVVIIDAMIIVCLYFWSASKANASISRAGLLVGITVLAVGIPTILPKAFNRRVVERCELGEIVSINGKLHCIVDYGEWQGIRLPLERHIDGFTKLETGEWILVVYRPNCQHCVSAINSVLSNPSWRHLQIALVCIEKSKEDRSNEFREDRVESFTFASEINTIFDVPAIMKVRNGVVVEICEVP